MTDASPVSPDSSPASAPRSNRRLLPLACGNFLIGTGTFIVAGLLNEIAADLNTSIAAVGQILSGYSLALAFGAPLLAWLTTRIERHALIAASLLCYGLLHIAAAFMPDYVSLMAVRVVTGFAAAVVTPQSVATAGLLVPPEARGRAITFVFLGFSLSTVVGVPLGTALGAILGWRIALQLVGIAALGGALWVWLALPRGLLVPPMDGRAWRSLRVNRAILWVVATTVLFSAGQFVLYTYLAPVFKASLAADARTIGLLFGWFGACGVAGNLIAVRLIDRAGSTRVVGVCIGLMMATFALWPLTQGSLAFSVFAIMLWGLGCFALNAAQQTRLVALSPQVASASVALNSSGIYLGQAIGGAIGGILISSGGGALIAGVSDNAGLAWLSWAGLVILLGAGAAAWRAGVLSARQTSGGAAHH